MKYLLTVFAFAFITCCKKTDSLQAELAKLPPITQTGANTFGCLVNGKAVTPNSSCTNCPPPISADYDFDPNGFFGIGCYYENGKRTIIVGLDSILTYRNYIINDNLNKNVRVTIANLNDTSICERVGTYYPFESINGYVKLNRVDIPNGIFCGTFEFTIKTKNCGNYEVTNGRFDYKF